MVLEGQRLGFVLSHVLHFMYDAHCSYGTKSGYALALSVGAEMHYICMHGWK